MVEVGTGGTGSRFLKTEWPIDEGLTAGTQKQKGRKMHLEAEIDLTEEKEKELL